jgi:hypothetical protein
MITYYVGVAVFIYCLGPMVVINYIPFISVFFYIYSKKLDPKRGQKYGSGMCWWAFSTER